MAFNIEEVNNVIGGQTAKVESELKAFQRSMDPNSQQDLLKFQYMMNRWNLVTNLQSNTIKTMKETLQSTIRNMV
ncbi:hypothetical protein H0A36_09855 [Endozoicomonas sp. SM1973]|uniref:EscF/YscF/HrpA family type III secretion system needle major subunit n=1 Tax=Spartinivicinus marinus TaxID=2994442 RepID=A0A853I8A5_9GAMM|nr:EscF/YscF/HrpA family type III secretion system needle major subunit [Spartinivicinus marinus]MCX4024659.1 hypothetical protein [Spartinivicinus marinus]NYZ66314.1 hypothetical protein [Spartinivicinus marinus]